MINFRQKAFTEYDAMRTLYETIRRMTHGDMRNFPVIDQSSLIPILRGNNIVVERFVISTSFFGKDKYRMYLKIGAKAKLPDQVRLPQVKEYDKRLGNLSLQMSNSIPEIPQPSYYENKAENGEEEFDFMDDFANERGLGYNYKDKGRIEFYRKKPEVPEKGKYDKLNDAFEDYLEEEEWRKDHPGIDLSGYSDKGRPIFKKKPTLNDKYKSWANSNKAEIDKFNKTHKKDKVEAYLDKDGNVKFREKKFSGNNNNKNKTYPFATGSLGTNLDIKYKVRELLGDAVKYDKPGRTLVLEFNTPEDAVKALNLLPFGIGYKIYLLNV